MLHKSMKVMFLFPLLVLSGGTLFAHNDKQALELARDGSTSYVIVQADQVTEPETLSVQELSNFLSRVTGAAFPVASESVFSTEMPGIYVGWTRFAAQKGIEAAKLGEEEWIIRSVGKDIIITGGRPRGTLYSVYEFLEKQAGCLWLARDTEIIPFRPTLELPRLDIQGQPVIAGRDIYKALGHLRRPIKMPSLDMLRKDKMFRLRRKDNGCGMDTAGAFYRTTGSPGTCHTFSQYMNASEWFESHPEYFSLVGGKRIPANNSTGPGQMCMTHPDVRKIVLEKLRGYIRKDRENAAKKGIPPPWIYDISQNDAGSSECQCENCQAIAKREGSQSGPLIDFINAIADGIKDEYPDVIVQTFAYNRTEGPPKTLKSRPNVMIRWCDVYGTSELLRPLKHPYNSRNYTEITGWGKIASHLAVWDYWMNFCYYRYFTPFCMIQCIGPDLKLFADMHAKTLFTQAENESHESGEHFTALKNWLGYKLMVNPYQPVEPLIQTFMEGYYGSAAPHMNRYLKYLEGRIDKEAEFMVLRKNSYNLKYLDLDFFMTADKLLDEAEKAVTPGTLEALHVQKERLIVDGGLLFFWPWLDRKLAPEESMPFDHEAVVSRFEEGACAQAKASFNEQAQVLQEKRIAKQAALFRDPKLPAPFRTLPSRDVADFNWLSFSAFTPGRQHYVEDADGAGGMAVCCKSTDDSVYETPPTFGVTGGATITLKPEEVPQDGAYHVYKIGRLTVKKGSLVWALDGKKLGMNVERLFVPDAKDPRINDWDAYISLKFRGPAYVKGSTETNCVWMDRILLVKPRKHEKADASELRRQEEEKQLAILRAAPPPQVQLKQSPKGAAGDPLKVDWNQSATGGEWHTILGYSTPRQVEIRFAQDGEYLYIRLMEELNPETLVVGEGIWNGDFWEIMFSSKREGNYFHLLAVNAKGAHIEMAPGATSAVWDSGVTVKSGTGADAWNVSLGFPLDRLLPGGVKPGQTVYMNALRGFGSKGDTLAWSPNFENDFHLLARLGKIVLQ